MEWRDPAAAWRGCDALLIRSPWDYHAHFPAFEAWLDAVDAAGIPTLNPTRIVRWNLRKTYLLELGEAGLPVRR